jgi:hypothetical protein
MSQTVSFPGGGNDQRVSGNTAARYQAGVLKYRDMGYWVPGYQPKDTDLIALFRRKASIPRKRPPRWRVNPPLRPGRSSGPTG